MMLRFSKFGRDLGYHDDKCMENINSIGSIIAKNYEISENSELSVCPEMFFFLCFSL